MYEITNRRRILKLPLYCGDAQFNTETHVSFDPDRSTWQVIELKGNENRCKVIVNGITYDVGTSVQDVIDAIMEQGKHAPKVPT